MSQSRYRPGVGSIAHAVHRATGILLALYIFAHLYILGHLRSADRFQGLVELMQNPWVKVFEVALAGVVAAHAFNGVRVILSEAGLPSRYQKALAVVAVLGLIGILSLALGGGMR